MAMISYAQNGEDVVLDRAFPPDYQGFYIDVGAADPTVDSVTMHFYEKGWSGVNIEPALGAFDPLAQARPRDLNLNVGVADAPGELTFYELPRQMVGCSTFSPELASEYVDLGWEAIERIVPVMTLREICECHVNDRVVDFMKIDVEGDERRVLEGADLRRFRPRILVVEATVPGTTIPSHEDWEPILLKADYEFVLFDGINRFFVRSEDEGLKDKLCAPANVLDDYVSYRMKLCLEDRDGLRREVDEWRGQVDAQRLRLSDVNESLRLTREELLHSRRELADAQIELTAARAALIARSRGC